MRDFRRTYIFTGLIASLSKSQKILGSITFTALIIITLSTTACTPKSDKLFATDCENNNPNCADSEFLLSTIGSRSDVLKTAIANGTRLSDAILMKPIRKGEPTGVEVTITNHRLAPLKNFSMSMTPGGSALTLDTNSSDDCSKKTLLFYSQSCTITVIFSGTQVMPDQELNFNFNSLLNDNVRFDVALSGTKILSDFYIEGDPKFETHEVVHDPNYNAHSTELANKEFTVTNDGSEDAIADLNFLISGPNADEFTVLSDISDPNLCVAGQSLLANGGTCKVKVQFKPLSAGDRRALLTFSGAGEFGRSYYLEGHALAVEADATHLDFGSQILTLLPSPDDGSVEKTVNFTLRSSASSSARNCSATLSNNPHFAITANSCDGTMSPGESCSVSVRFTPQATSAVHNHTLEFSCTERGGSLSLGLIGQSSTSHLEVSKNVLDFGDRLVGGSSSEQLILTNNGTATFTNLNATLTAVTVTSDLSKSSTNCTEILAGGASCNVTVTFSPGSAALSASSFYATANQASLENETLIQGRGISIYPSLESFDFGAILIGKDRVGPEIEIINPSTSQSATGCSLDVTGFSGQGFSLDPGSTCTNTVTLNAGGRCTLKPRFTASGSEGARSANITFNCSVGGTATVTLEAEAVSDLRLVLIPPRTINFANRLVGITGIANYTYVNADSQDSAFNISVPLPALPPAWSFVSSGSADCAGKDLAPGQTCQTRLRFSPSATPGAEDTSNSLGALSPTADSAEATDDNSIMGSTANFKGNALKLMISRPVYDFGILKTNQVTTSPFILIENPSPVDFAYGCSVQLSTDFDFVQNSCGSFLRPKEICAFRVKNKSQSVSKMLSGSAQMTCLVGGRASISITGMVQKPPTLNWSAVTSSNFGYVDIGSSQTLTFRLTNSGLPLDRAAMNLALSIISSMPSPFTIDSTTCSSTLTSQTSCTANVKFTPTSTTATSGSLRASEQTESATISFIGDGVDTNQRVVLSTSSVSFTNRLVGVETYQEITLTNQAEFGNTTGLSISSPSSGAPWFTGTSSNPCSGTLAVGASCVARIEYKPTITGTSSGTVNLTAANLTSSKTISYTGSATKISANQTSLNFGVLDLQTTKTHSTRVTVSNPSNIDNASSCSLSTNHSSFQIGPHNTCGTSIPPGSSCSFAVTFGPHVVDESVNAKATMNCAVGGSISVDLMAQAKDLPALTLSAVAPSSTDFGSIDIDAGSKNQIYSLKNNEAESVSLTDIGLKNGSSSFSLLSAGTTCNANTTLAPGGQCFFTVSFDPTSDSTATGGEATTLYARINTPVTFDFDLPLTGTGTTMILTATPQSINFSKREVGQAGEETVSVTLSNLGSRTAHLTYSSLALPISNTGTTCGATLAVGASCTLPFKIQAHTSAQVHNQTFIVTDNYGSSSKSVSISLSGETVRAPVLQIASQDDTNSFMTAIPSADITSATANPNREIYGLSPASQEMLFNLKSIELDSSNLVDILIELEAVSGTSGAVTLLSNNCSTLTPTQTCTFKVRYRPTTNYEETHVKLVVTAKSELTNTSQTVTITDLMGRSRRAVDLTITPASYTFSGPLEISTSGTTTFTVTNNGDQKVTNLSFSFDGTNPTLFSKLGTSSCTSQLNGNSSCTVRVAFNPGTNAGAFTANLKSQGDQAGAAKAVTLKAASYSSHVISTADFSGLEPALTADADRIYMVSRKEDGSTGSHYRPVVTICKRNTTGMAVPTDCEENEIVTRLGLTNAMDIQGSNFASEQQGSGPKIAEFGNKIVVAVENKDSLLGATASGSVSTLVVCQKPATGSTTLGDCAKTVVNNNPGSGQFPALHVSATKIFLANSNSNNDLDLNICDFDPAATPSTAVSSANCSTNSLDHVSSEEGRYPSLAFENDRIVIATRTAGSESAQGYLKIQACELNMATRTLLNCNGEIINVGQAALNEGLYPNVALKNSRLYVVHQRMTAQDSGILRLTWCNLQNNPAAMGSTLNGASCDSQTVASSGISGGTSFYQTPTISILNNRAWITFAYSVDPQTDASHASIDVRHCDISTASPSCSSAATYLQYGKAQGSFPLLTRSAYIDPNFKMLIAPFTAIDNIVPLFQYDQRLGLYQLGLLPEL